MEPYRMPTRISMRYNLLTLLFLTMVLHLLSGGRADAAPGDLDPDFGTDGQFFTSIIAGTDDFGRALALQEDGKIVVVGSNGSGSNARFAVARLNADGTLDDKFLGCDPTDDDLCFDATPDGTTAFSMNTNSEDRSHAVAIQDDGKIVVVGSNRANTSSVVRFAVARLLPTGRMDTDFGTKGRTFFSFLTNSTEEAFAVAIQPDGKILVAGSAGVSGGTTGFGIARLLDTTGALDSTGFGTGGQVTVPVSNGGDVAYGLALQEDGKIVVAGRSNLASPDNSQFAVVRLTSGGSLDTDFGTDGQVTTPIIAGTNDGAWAVAIQSDGKILAAGTSGIGSGISNFALARWDTSGTPDSAFGTDTVSETGTTTISFTNFNDGAFAVAIQSDSKIIVAGFSGENTINANFALARLNLDGSLDTSFGSGGQVTTAFSSGNDAARGVGIQPDGKIVAAGLRAIGTTNLAEFAAARYLGDDSGLDPSFGSDGTGTETTDFNTGDDEGGGLALRSNGDIVAAGFSETGSSSGVFHFSLAGYDRNGIEQFTNSTPSLSDNDRGQAVSIQQVGSEEKIVVVGHTGVGAGSLDFMVARYNDDGTLDTSFNSSAGATAGMIATDIAGVTGDDRAFAVAIQEDGKIVVAGEATQSGKLNIAVVRYLADGSGLDPTFGDLASGKKLRLWAPVTPVPLPL